MALRRIEDGMAGDAVKVADQIALGSPAVLRGGSVSKLPFGAIG